MLGSRCICNDQHGTMVVMPATIDAPTLDDLLPPQPDCSVTDLTAAIARLKPVKAKRWAELDKARNTVRGLPSRIADAVANGDDITSLAAQAAKLTAEASRLEAEHTALSNASLVLATRRFNATRADPVWQEWETECRRIRDLYREATNPKMEGDRYTLIKDDAERARLAANRRDTIIGNLHGLAGRLAAERANPRDSGLLRLGRGRR